MLFTWKAWENFCSKLERSGIFSIPACAVSSDMAKYVVLKHDVETDVPLAYQLASIEYAHGHHGSYYVQAYLLHSSANVDLLQKMQQMGHEISYHHDVMDSSKGDLSAAIKEFDQNLQLFERNGFRIATVCQHGNPVVVREGYTSNRDFFRSQIVQERYPTMSDIMVNFHLKVPTSFQYFSDAGRQFKWIYDPFENDITNSDDKNIPYDDLDQLYDALSHDSGNMISIHPHRWMRSAGLVVVKNTAFRCIKAVAKFFIKIPFLKAIMSKYYYLAKKI